MKIGVAFSGCDIGGIAAWRVLRELELQGFDIAMISACCVPAITSLLFSYGCEDTVMELLSQQFLRDCHELDIDYAIANISANVKTGPNKKIPLAINAANVTDGRIVMFTDDYSLQCGNIETVGLENSYDALSATTSLMDGLGSYRYGDLRLCDFCCWHGCPIHQLKLAGIQKIISVALLPKLAKTPYEVMTKQMIAKSSAAADVHILIEPEKRDMQLDEYIEIATGKIKSNTNIMLLKTLF